MKAMLAYLLFTLILVFSCTDEQESLPVEFEFQLHNEAGAPSTSFAQDDNFIFSFSIKNVSSETLMFQSMNTEEFFKVYRIQSNEGNSVLEIGKPYINIFCTYQNGYPIAPNETLRIEIPWRPVPWEIGAPFYSTIFCGVNENALLSTGQYRTGFDSKFYFTFKGKQYITPSQEFEIDFNIQ